MDVPWLRARSDLGPHKPSGGASRCITGCVPGLDTAVEQECQCFWELKRYVYVSLAYSCGRMVVVRIVRALACVGFAWHARHSELLCERQ